MTTKRALAPAAIEKRLRERFNETEYRVLQARLTGAMKAVESLRDRAPDLLPLMFGDSLERARTLAPHTQHALAVLIDELLHAATDNKSGDIDRRKLLRLVERVSRLDGRKGESG